MQGTAWKRKVMPGAGCIDVRGLNVVASCNCTGFKWLLSIMKALIRETAGLKHS